MLPVSITRHQLERFVALQTERRALESKARILEAEEQVIRAALIDVCKKNGNSITKFGYRCIVTQRAGQPRYKDELLKLIGAESLEKMKSKTPAINVLTVSAPSS